MTTRRDSTSISSSASATKATQSRRLKASAMARAKSMFSWPIAFQYLSIGKTARPHVLRRVLPRPGRVARLPQLDLRSLPEVRGARLGRARGADRDDQARVRRRGEVGLGAELQEDPRRLSDPPQPRGARALRVLRSRPRGQAGWISCRPWLHAARLRPDAGPVDPLRRSESGRTPRR